MRWASPAVLLLVGCAGTAPGDDTSSPFQSVCSPYLPADTPRLETWEAVPGNDIATGGFTRLYTGELAEAPGTYRAETDTLYDFIDPPSLFESEAWVEYTCDEIGVWLQSRGGRFRSDGGAWQDWSEVTLDPMLYMPNDLTGDWTRSVRLERTENGATEERFWEEAHEVIGDVVVDLPSGTFQSIELRSSIGGGPWTHYHVVEDVGWVLFVGSIQLAAVD